MSNYFDHLLLLRVISVQAQNYRHYLSFLEYVIRFCIISFVFRYFSVMVPCTSLSCLSISVLINVMHFRYHTMHLAVCKTT